MNVLTSDFVTTVLPILHRLGTKTFKVNCQRIDDKNSESKTMPSFDGNDDGGDQHHQEQQQSFIQRCVQMQTT